MSSNCGSQQRVRGQVPKVVLAFMVKSPINPHDVSDGEGNDVDKGVVEVAFRAAEAELEIWLEDSEMDESRVKLALLEPVVRIGPVLLAEMLEALVVEFNPRGAEVLLTETLVDELNP